MRATQALNVAVIGTGWWGGVLVEFLAGIRNVKVSAVQNRTIDRARQLAAQYEIPTVCGSVEELCCLPDLDGVIIATHESMHLQQTICALDAGKHVFVEKPMADGSEDAFEMARHARRRQLILMPGHVVRFTAQCRAVKKALAAAGAPVLAIRCYQHRTRDRYETYCKPHLAMKLMIHQLDLCRWFADAPVAKVRARERYFLGPDYPSSLWAMLEFESGGIATLETGWLLTGTQPGFWEDGLEVITEENRFTIAFNDGYEVRGPDGVARPDVFYDPALHLELDYWLGCVEHGREPDVVTPEDGAEAVLLAERVIAAARAESNGGRGQRG